MTPTYATRVKRFTVPDALYMLQHLECGQDDITLLTALLYPEGVGPIRTPNDLCGNFDFRKATEVRIEYASGPKGKWVRGTLQTMVLDRLRYDS